MLYNMKLNREMQTTDCFLCEKYDVKTRTCNGIGEICNPVDPLTHVVTDAISGLPLKLDKKEVENGTSK